MTLGQEFDAFHVTIKEDIDRLQEAAALFREINLGATAIGTGINTDPRYASLAVAELARLSGQRMVLAANLIEATSDMGAFVLFSGVLKRIAVKLSKICNDLAPALLRSARGLWRNSPARRPGRILDHAGQGQSGDPRGGQSGRLSRHRPRSDRDNVRRGRTAPAQCFRADDRLFHPDIAAHATAAIDTLTQPLR